MAFYINQTPATASLSQSPMAYTLYESSDLVTSQSFQYMLDLYFWTGSRTNSGSASDYTLVKYPNQSNCGIFDVSRIMNSELNEYAIIDGIDNTKWFTADAYYQYQSGSVFITGSKQRDLTHLALDGYSLFPENVNHQLYQKTAFFPMLTDGPATQSVFRDQLVLEKEVYLTNTGNGKVPQFERYRINYTSGSITNQVVGTFSIFPIASGSNDQQIARFNIAPSQFSAVSYPIINWIEYSILDQSGSDYSRPIRFNVVCEQKYPNIQLMWKNRYGCFDYFNFDMVNRKSFEVNRSQYQPQIGTFDSIQLDYGSYESSILNYLVDTKEAISVNTNWVSEDYNDIFKQLLVSDEIYWIYDPEIYAYYGSDSGGIKPITIKTNTIQFKTGVNDKVIQYQFDFDYGQSYKLIL
jgi:hypothetical protein